MKHSSLLSNVAFSGVLVICGLIAYILYSIGTEVSAEGKKEVESRIENSQWSLHQFDLEYYRFMREFDAYNLSKVSIASLQRRYDIFISRIPTLRNDHFLIMTDGSALSTELDNISHKIQSWETELYSNEKEHDLKEASNRAHELEGELRQFIVNVHQKTATYKAENREKFISRMKKLVGNMFGLGACACGLMLLLYTQMRREAASRRQAERLAAELESARNTAVAADKAKSLFLGTMSHEIRTPVSGIIGMAGLLLESGLSGDQRRWAEGVKNSASNLLAVFSDMLEFSRIENSEIRLSQKPFDIDGLIESALELNAIEASQKGIWLEYIVQPDVHSIVIGDHTRLLQVINNLVNNAIKFTESGGVLVRVNAINSTADAVRLRVAIEDTGVGIAAEDQGKLFIAFSQIDQETSRKYGGTGLGLAICRGLLERMGGRIGVESTPGEGSTFWFEVELAKGTESLHRAHPRSSEPPSVHVAVASSAVREAVMSKVQRLGFRVSSSTTMAKVPSDAPITVCELASLEEALLRAGEHPERVIVLVSAEADVSGGLGAELIVKPVRRAALADALRRASGEGESPAQTLRVLLAEDSEVIRDIICEMVQHLGHFVKAVADGAQAVMAIEEESFDIVLMDVQMPIIDGLNATRQIRAMSGNRGCVPIIAVTANVHNDEEQRCYEAGMDIFVGKPVTLEILERAINAALQKNHGPHGKQRA